MFSTFVKSNGSGYDLQKWFPENRKTSYRINIFENFKSCSCFRLLSVKQKCLRPPEIVSKNRKTSTRINIFENKFKSDACFRLLSSQIEAFTTTRNGFREPEDVISNQHFRKNSSPVHVFDYCQSNGSVYDLRK